MASAGKEGHPDRPPFDKAFTQAAGIGISWQTLRQFTETTSPSTLLAAHPDIVHADIKIPAIEGLGENETTLAIFQSKTCGSRHRPAILFVHGGGQVVGNRFFGVEPFLNIVEDARDVVLVSVEYRLAPAHRAPAGAHDCYAAAVNLAENATELGIDASRILIYGVSGGAGPAAAACMLARERNHPSIRAQMLSIPMLDDRDSYSSHKQFEFGTVWDGKINREAWDMILGAKRDSSTGIQVPGRLADLSNLPPTFINVGECEVFRDSAVAFASKIWSSGGSCELHVWPGLYHGGMSMEPHAPVSQAATAAEMDFMQRTLGLKKGDGHARGVAQASL